MLRMKFNCDRMYSLATGEPCASQPSFSAGVVKQGSFLARVKRTGQRSKHIGWVDLFLLDTERLAICYLDESPSPQGESSLVFPLVTGSEFGEVKRHGNALTLHAMRVSIIFEAEAIDAADVEYSSALAGKWARYLNRLVSGESANMSGVGQPEMGGLGISVHAAKSVPFIPMKAPADRSRPRTKQLVPPQPAAVPRGGVQSMYAPQIASFKTAVPSFPSVQSLSKIPNSRSLKRISLCLAGESDLGFGDDLKNVLSTLDQEEDEEEEEIESEAGNAAVNKDTNTQSQIPPSKSMSLFECAREDSEHDIPSALLPTDNFDVPSIPLSLTDTSIDSANSTPSPNSLYLQGESSSPPLDFSMGSSPRRLASILAKEQQQYVEKYGARASTISVKPIRQIKPSREPPNIPAPMPSKERKNDSVPQATSKTSDVPSPADKKESAPRTSAKPSRLVSSAKQGPVLTRKSVSIAPVVQVIKDTEDDDSEDDEPEKLTTGLASSEKLDLPDKLSPPKPFSPRSASSASPRFSSPIFSSPKFEQKTRFVKAMKRILSKKKPSKESSAQYHNGADKPPHKTSEEDDNGESAAVRTSSNNKDDDASSDDRNGSRSTLTEANVMKEESEEKTAWPTPDSIDVGPRTHAYANFAEPETPSVSGTPEPRSATRDGAATPREVVADATNNGGTTAAVPKLNSNKSISALSFRSLSSRSLALSASASAANVPASVTSGRSEKSLDTILQPSTNSAVINSSPVLLRRESRTELDPVPINLEVTSSALVDRMYENTNKSTSALPSVRQSITSAPAPKHPSASSSYSSFGSKRSLHSYTSSLSSASSFSTPNLLGSENAKTDISLFSAQLWVSAWNNSRWQPLSQQELRTEILANDTNTARINIVGFGVSVKFTPQCEIRRVGNHDVEVKGPEDTYMFRGRDPENALRFFRTLWTLQANGVQAVAAAALASSMSFSSFKGSEDEDNVFLSRRKTMIPPSLSRSNQNLRYMGRSTETIIEE